MSPDRRRRALRWAERVAAGLVVAFLVVYLARNWAQVRAYDWSIAWGPLALAALLHALVYTGFVLLWRRLLAVLGGRLSVLDAHRIWYMGNLGRYVPGKVLQVVGVAYLARSRGVSPVLTVASAIVSQLFVLATGCVVVAVGLPGLAGHPRVGVGAWVLAGLLLAVLLTPLFDRLYHLALRLSGREEYHVEVAWSERLRLTVAYLVVWGLYGTAFWLFLRSVVHVGADALPGVAAIWAAGYVAGWVAVFVPGGLGVREGVYAALLALYIPPTIAVATAVLARVWSTAVELAVAGGLLARYGLADLRAGAPPETRDAHG